ncbi:MAG: hypothetical protein GC185_02435 [Alphaproteobacteria bacterium]|nr:hypothetical protein [Alphaproteobacteria bacterium]
MDVGKPVDQTVGDKAEVAGRDGSKLMRTVEGLMLAGATLALIEDLSGPRMRVGSSILDVTGNRGEVVGNTRGDLFRTLVAESMIIGAFELAEDLANKGPERKQSVTMNNNSKPALL